MHSGDGCMCGIMMQVSMPLAGDLMLGTCLYVSLVDLAIYCNRETCLITAECFSLYLASMLVLLELSPQPP